MTPTSLYEKLSRHGAPPTPIEEWVSPRITLLNTLPSKEYFLRGEPAVCYSIGSVAKVLGKSQVTIRSWEQKGWMPMPKARTAAPQRPTIEGKAVKGRRLYTRQQVEYLIQAFESANLGDSKKADWPKFKQLLQQYPTV